jgi:hypothetical protein
MDEQLHLNKERSLSKESVISQRTACSSASLSPELDNQESELLTPTTTKPQFKTGEYILNGRVGKIIEAIPGEYFSVKYGNSHTDHTDLKCYFWGQDDELIDQLAIPTERFAIAPQELVEKFLGENTNTSQISPKKKKVASGSLAPYLENKKLKNGQIVTYPRVTGERDKSNHLHWKWGYYYEIKIDGEWKNRSLPTPARIVPQVKILIENHGSVEEIKDFILQSKHKKGNF